MERLNPYRDHRLEITVRDEKLVVRKKIGWQLDAELSELYASRAKQYIASETIPKHPFAFHVRYYWRGAIKAKVINPEVDAGWEAPAGTQTTPALTICARFNAGVLALARTLFSQRSRNRKLKLDSLLACPSCRNTDLEIGNILIHCRECAAEYPVRNGLPVMFADAGKHPGA